MSKEGAPCKHNWVDVGTTTYSGDNWMQEFVVYWCRNCKQVGVNKNPSAYFDYAKRRSNAEVSALRKKEEEDYATLVERLGTDPEVVIAERTAARAARKEAVSQAKERAAAAAGQANNRGGGGDSRAGGAAG